MQWFWNSYSEQYLPYIVIVKQIKEEVIWIQEFGFGISFVFNISFYWPEQICGQYLLSASVYKTALIELYLFRETHKKVLRMLVFFCFLILTPRVISVEIVNYLQ